MAIDPSAVWDFAREVVGAARTDRGRTLATVTRIDPDGTTWVTTGDGGEAPAASSAAGVSVGDTVTVEWDGAAMGIRGNVSNPSPAGSVVRRAVARAQGVADAAQRVADAVNQHFFADGNGIHVTEATQEEWETSHSGANVLINSVGQLFRDGLNNLLTLTTENGARALTIWDGLGNAAANVRAVFGEVITLGNTTIGSVVTIDSDGMDVAKGGDSVANFGATSRVGSESGYHVGLSPSNVSFVDSESNTAFTIEDRYYEGDEEFQPASETRLAFHEGLSLLESTRHGSDLDTGFVDMSLKTANVSEDTYAELRMIMNDYGADSSIACSTDQKLASIGCYVNQTDSYIALSADRVAYWEDTCTIESGATQYNLNACWSNGACCTISLSVNLTSALANGGTVRIATAPSGYVPPYSVIGSCYVTGATAQVMAIIGTGGGITLNNRSGSTIPTTANVYVSFTFAPA